MNLVFSSQNLSSKVSHTTPHATATHATVLIFCTSFHSPTLSRVSIVMFSSYRATSVAPMWPENPRGNWYLLLVPVLFFKTGYEPNYYLHLFHRCIYMINFPKLWWLPDRGPQMFKGKHVMIFLIIIIPLANSETQYTTSDHCTIFSNTAPPPTPVHVCVCATARWVLLSWFQTVPWNSV